MGRDATKAAGNPWYQARKKAAEYDDRLKKDDLVLVRNSRGEVPAVCVCDSFSVPENVLEQLQKMYGGKTLKWVIGSVEFLRWEQEKEEEK